MNHPISVNGYDLKDLAEKVGSLRYDAAAAYAKHLSDDFDRQAQADSKSGKGILATEGFRAATKLRELEIILRKMMDISRPFMREDLGERPEIN